MRYIFPFTEIPIRSKIVIYGATQTGYDFYRQVKTTGYCEVVAWVDRQYLWWGEMNLPVDSPENITKLEYDRVILTAETKRVADSMRNDLVGLGVPEEKIFWKDDYLIRENIAKDYDPERVHKEAAEAIEEIPAKYITGETLDIIVMVMYARDILQNIDNTGHREMFRKLLNQHDGKEPVEDMVHSYFTEYDVKRGWKAFDESFRELVFSIRDNGFDREYFIPVDSDGGLINGRHRLAAAIANDIPVWTRRYLFSGFHFHFDETWLSQLGFTKEEISETLGEYERIIGGHDDA